MATKTMKLDIVSAESSIFSGEVEYLMVTGSAGELGIHPGHTALLTSLKPGQVHAKIVGQDTDEVFYISGGMLEVQPNIVTLLSDTAARAGDLDESAAIAARERAEKALQEQSAEFEYSAAVKELAQAVAQLRAIQSLREKIK